MRPKSRLPNYIRCQPRYVGDVDTGAVDSASLLTNKETVEIRNKACRFSYDRHNRGVRKTNKSGEGKSGHKSQKDGGRTGELCWAETGRDNNKLCTLLGLMCLSLPWFFASACPLNCYSCSTFNCYVLM